MSSSNGQAKALTPSDVLNLDDRAVFYVDCPEWGGRVYMRELSGVQRDELDKLYGEPNVSIRAAAVAMSWCDEHGQNIVIEKQQMMALAQKSAKCIDECWAELSPRSGIGAKSVDESKKNSEETQSGDSGSD